MTAHLRPALVNDYIWSAVSTTWKTPREGADQSTAQMSPASTASNTLEKPQVAPAPDYSVLNTDLSEGAPRQLHEVPTFTSALEKRQWAKQHMAGACRMFARLFPDGASGHISLRDPVNPSCFWISTSHPSIHPSIPPDRLPQHRYSKSLASPNRRNPKIHMACTLL